MAHSMSREVCLLNLINSTQPSSLLWDLKSPKDALGCLKLLSVTQCKKGFNTLELSLYKVTCDQTSLFFFSQRKVHLIQLLDYSSVASLESGLFSDWSRNKGYLELSHDWLPVWQCDFRSKKSLELMDSLNFGV